MVLNMFDKQNQQSQAGYTEASSSLSVECVAHCCLPGPLVASPSAPADRGYVCLFIPANLIKSGSREDGSNGFWSMCDITSPCRFFLKSLLKRKM